jgi:UDP-N-acetylglucosamine 2-epimerase (non-hydrolysing)
MDRIAVGVVMGTRPEAIKLAPIVRALATSTRLRPVVIVTGQHRELLDDALRSLAIDVDVDLALMTAQQSPADVTARVLQALPPIFAAHGVRAVLVQGDTTTALGGALAGYFARLPVGHVEAGLRTGDHENPFPEEGTRQLIARVARWSFAPTAVAAENLRREDIAADRVFVVGNTAVDSILWMSARAGGAGVAPGFVLVTLHRRESFGEPLAAIARGLLAFLDDEAAAHAVWPLHPNPRVKASVEELVRGHPRVALLPAQPYAAFVALLRDARLVLTDSGGIQEEAPSLGKRVLIARETTERAEAIAAGLSRLVGRSTDAVHRALLSAWHEPPYAGPLPAPNPYGDGDAAVRIVGILERALP